jgi:hypothetical protein
MTFIDVYDVFVVVDNLNDYSEIQQKYPKISIVQISDDDCIRANYTNSDFIFKPIVATDRAYYYFNRVNTKYKHVWFCEDDVFIHNKNQILSLDQQYSTTDPFSEVTTDGKNSWPHWSNIDNTLPLPWAHNIICLVRISKELLAKVDEFVILNRKLIYKEILFHTLALHNNMAIETPDSMSKIRFKPEWDVADVVAEKKYIYHPIKDVQKHIDLRQ